MDARTVENATFTLVKCLHSLQNDAIRRDPTFRAYDPRGDAPTGARTAPRS